jgi:hypothetical protein
VIARALLVVIAIVMSLMFAELATRSVDGYQLFSIDLERVRDVQPRTTPDRQYLPSGLADGVDPAWYEETPDPVPVPVGTPEVMKRATSHAADVYSPFFWWNGAFVRDQVCRGGGGLPDSLDDFYSFEPADGAMYPTYRHIPHLAAPGWFRPNAFGWRGPEISAARQPNRIRIAFVGASTTIGVYSSRFSHPEIIGYWLNRWAESRHLPYRFETINAARTGVDARSIEAIVRTEVLSVDPDLIVFYEGANNFAPASSLAMPDGIPERPHATFRQRSRAEKYSALASRVFDGWLKTGQDGSEPAKPRFASKWPTGLSEDSPDVTRADALPIGMNVVVKSLDAIRHSVATTGTELALSSFIWMVDDGMRLDLSRHLTLYRYLNETYWPVTYEHMHRMAAFENAVFRNYARTYGLAYVPMAESYPRDPDLFGDAIHLTERGLRLQAWLFLQQLIPIVEARTMLHAWPKAASPNRPSADWAAEPPRLVTRRSVLASCSATTH